MTHVAAESSIFERMLTVVMLTAFWTAFLALGAGLALWLHLRHEAGGPGLLRAGLIGLFVLPVLRLVWAMATAVRTRDWTLLGASVAVLAILLALTLRDAANL